MSLDFQEAIFCYNNGDSIKHRDYFERNNKLFKTSLFVF
jgi:hypothetical protein